MEGRCYRKKIFCAIKQFFTNYFKDCYDVLGKLHELNCLIFEYYDDNKPFLILIHHYDNLFVLRFLDRYNLAAIMMEKEDEKRLRALPPLPPTYFYRAIFEAFLIVVCKKRSQND